MKRIITYIDSCAKCPFISNGFITSYSVDIVCGHPLTNGRKHYSISIPTWCKLVEEEPPLELNPNDLVAIRRYK